MNVPLYIAKRYFLAKKSMNAIHIISWISVLGIMVGTMALLIVLSAFNGLEGLVANMYASFDPDIKITAKHQKTFSTEDFPTKKLLEINGIQAVEPALEEVMLIKHNDKQTIATVKGVSTDFVFHLGIDTMLIEGTLTPLKQSFAIVGRGVADKLTLFLEGNLFPEPLTVVVPKVSRKKSLSPMGDFHIKKISPSGIFQINPDFDSKYALVDRPFVEGLLKKKGKATSMEIILAVNSDEIQVKKEIQKIIGTDYEVKTRYELNEMIFKTNKTEKWITSLILSFILVIAAFNSISAITMLMIEKKKDTWILSTIGASRSFIQKIFFFEGVLINLIGASTGLLLGTLICLAQKQFGLVRLQNGIVDFYPIVLKLQDYALIASIIVVIGLISSWYPVWLFMRKKS